MSGFGFHDTPELPNIGVVPGKAGGMIIPRPLQPKPKIELPYDSEKESSIPSLPEDKYNLGEGSRLPDDIGNNVKARVTDTQTENFSFPYEAHSSGWGDKNSKQTTYDIPRSSDYSAEDLASSEDSASNTDTLDDSSPSKNSENANNNAAEGTEDGKELTEEEINALQQKAIREALEKLARGEELTNEEKGNLCEMMMDQYYIQQGYKPLHQRVTSLDDKGHKGIDGVYEKDGKFVICDAKYGSSKLGETQDGKQMSADWIDPRLDATVGKEKADEIRDAYDEGNVSTQVYHYDPNPDSSGTTHSDVVDVDENGEKKDSINLVEAYQDGHQVGIPDNTYGGDNRA